MRDPTGPSNSSCSVLTVLFWDAQPDQVTQAVLFYERTVTRTHIIHSFPKSTSNLELIVNWISKFWPITSFVNGHNCWKIFWKVKIDIFLCYPLCFRELRPCFVLLKTFKIIHDWRLERSKIFKILHNWSLCFWKPSKTFKLKVITFAQVYSVMSRIFVEILTLRAACIIINTFKYWY